MKILDVKVKGKMIPILKLKRVVWRMTRVVHLKTSTKVTSSTTRAKKRKSKSKSCNSSKAKSMTLMKKHT